MENFESNVSVNIYFHQESKSPFASGSLTSCKDFHAGQLSSYADYSDVHYQPFPTQMAGDLDIPVHRPEREYYENSLKIKTTHY